MSAWPALDPRLRPGYMGGWEQGLAQGVGSARQGGYFPEAPEILVPGSVEAETLHYFSAPPNEPK